MSRRPVSISTPLARQGAGAVGAVGAVGAPAPAHAPAPAPSADHTDLYQEVTCLHFLHVPPEFALDISRGAMQQLAALLLRWHADIQGVPLLYTRVELTPAPTTTPIPLPTLYPTPVTGSPVPVLSAAILGENPALHLWVRVRWLAFCPSQGSRIVGCVVKQSADQLTLLVLGLFHASIKRDQLAGTLDWHDALNAWSFPARDNRRIGPGDLLEFEVLGVKTDHGLVRITGSLDRMQQPAPLKKKTKKPALPPQ